MEDVALVCRAELVVHVDDRSTPGVLEGVLDDALTACHSDYVLRLDDDEALSHGAVTWLRDGRYTGADVWALPRAHLWGDERHFLTTVELWPDPQTRLTTRAKAGGRVEVHQGSPHGTGHSPPPGVLIEHHKFLVRDRAARLDIARRYEAAREGAGLGPHFMAFGLPEDHYTDLAVAVTEVFW
jgi:hypothetical protein